MKYLHALVVVAVASLVLAFPGVSRADNIKTFTVSGNFSPGYSWYFDPSSTVTIDTTTGTITDSYLAVDNTPNGSSGTPFTGAPTNVVTYFGSCISGYPQTCWSDYVARWVIGNNDVTLDWTATSSDGLSDPALSIIGFTGGSITDSYAYIGYPYLNWGSSATLTPVSVPTPEPGTLPLLGSGLLGLAGLLRRKIFA